MRSGAFSSARSGRRGSLSADFVPSFCLEKKENQSKKKEGKSEGKREIQEKERVERQMMEEKKKRTT